MEKEWKQTFIAIGIVAILIVGGFACVKAYSGLDNSLTVVVSGSMQHGDKSQIGVIDTGDMIIMKNKDKGITTYVDGYASGYKSFGDYGDVIIYNRENANPVIHRAICFIEYHKTYLSCPSLKNLDEDRYEFKGTDVNHFTSLTIKLPDWNNGGLLKTYSFDIKKTTCSGYLTKGDANDNFDQGGGISDSLINEDRIKAVAGVEIPWIGAIKLYIKGDTDDIQMNTPYCLVFMFLDILALIVVISIVWEYIDRRINN